MPLIIANRQRTHKINVRALREITTTLLAGLAGPGARLEINLVSRAQMAKVNQTFLQHEGPTDVITFDYREGLTGTETPGGAREETAGVQPKSPARTLRALKRPKGRAPGNIYGELFICPAVAAAQAREFGTEWRSELVRYVIHGLLHLAGYDDLAPAARRKMKRAEGRWVRMIGRRFALSKL